jgi:hypothetical protein
VKRRAAVAPDNPQQMYETVAAQERVFRLELLLGGFANMERFAWKLHRTIFQRLY